MTRVTRRPLSGGLSPVTASAMGPGCLLKKKAAKAKGKTVHIPEEEEPRATEVADIMAKLKESLSATRH